MLACEGLLDLVYSHDVDVLIKLVKLAPPCWHIFITKFPNAIKKGSERFWWVNSSVFSEVEAMLLSSQISSATFLMVLQELCSLSSSLNEGKDDYVPTYRYHDESVIIITSLNLVVELLWKQLGLCISKIEKLVIFIV